VKLSSPKEAEKEIIKMIESGEIFASINQKDGMVSFQEDPEHYDSNKTTTHLDQQIQKVIDIGKRLRTIDESIASSPHYLQKTTVHERGSRWGSDFDEFDPEKQLGAGPATGAAGPMGGRLM